MASEKHFSHAFFFLFERLFLWSFSKLLDTQREKQINKVVSISHVSCTLARGTTGCSMSLYFQFFCVYVFIDWVPAATLFPPFSASYYPSLTALLSQVFLTSCPSSTIFIKFTTKEEKKRIPNISKTSGCISLAGDCLAMELNVPLPFIRQALFMFKSCIT